MKRRSFLQSLISVVTMSPLLCRMAKKSEAHPILTYYRQDPDTLALIATTQQVVDADSISFPIMPPGVRVEFLAFGGGKCVKKVTTTFASA